jgi:hypothetical protein
MRTRRDHQRTRLDPPRTPAQGTGAPLLAGSAAARRAMAPAHGRLHDRRAR